MMLNKKLGWNPIDFTPVWNGVTSETLVIAPKGGPNFFSRHGESKTFDYDHGSLVGAHSDGLFRGAR